MRLTELWAASVVMVAGLGLMVALSVALDWLIATRSTDPRLLKTSSTIRLWRWLRSVCYRMGFNLFGWPHALELPLKTKRAAVSQTPNDIVWRNGATSLRHYKRLGAAGPAVLVVHSLISKPWILDLSPGASLVEFLMDEGFDVYLLDWGDPTASEAAHGLSFCADTLMQAEKEVLAHTESQQLHLLGYCLGGLVCLLRAGARAHPGIASIILLATPVDFGLKIGLQPFISHRLFKPVCFLDDSSCVPASALRESFHVLRPRAVKAVIAAWAQRNDPEFRRLYDPLARWVWEHRALPGQMFFDLVDLFRTNALLEDRLVVCGEPARLRNVQVPVLALIAERDHIVPPASSAVLENVQGIDVSVVSLPAGHVSMISGAAATTGTWPSISKWIRAKG